MLLSFIILFNSVPFIFSGPSPVAGEGSVETGHNDHHVFFRHVGATIPTLSYVHVAFKIDIMSVLDNLLSLQSALDRTMEEYQNFTRDAKIILPTKGTQTWKVFRHQQDTLADLIDNVQTIMTLGEKTAVDRPKRFIVLAALGIAALAASIFGIYTQTQINNMQHELDEAGKQAKTIVDVEYKLNTMLSNNSVAIQALEDDNDLIKKKLATFELMGVFQRRIDTFNAAMTHAQSDVHLIEHLVEAMMEGRTSLKLFRHQDLPKLISSIQEKAAKFGLSSLIYHYADLLQCQTSFTFTDSGLTLFVHTPAHVDNTMLTIMEHVPFPIRVDDNYFAEVSTNLRYLAVHESSQTFAVFTQPEIQACDKRGTLFLCKHNNIVDVYDPDRKGKDPATCLNALFRQDYATIKETCDINIVPESDRVMQFDEHTFWTYAKEPHQGQVFCPNKKPYRFSVDHTAEVKLETGCTATTDTHRFTASADLTVDRWEYHWGWPAKYRVNLTDGLDLAKYHAYMQAIPPHRRHAAPKEVRAIKDELDSIHTNSWLHHKDGFITSAVGIAWIFIIGSVIIGVCLCLRLRARRAVDQPDLARQPAFNHYPVIQHGQPVQVVVNNDTMHMQQQQPPAPCAPEKPF